MKYLKSQKRTPNLLLGNGFSMAYDRTIFSYNALSDFVENTSNDLLKKLFKVVNNKNFEQIMLNLNISKDIIEAFNGDKDLIDKIEQTSTALKASLLDAVKSLHPEHVFSIPDVKSKACATFVQHYLDNKGTIFSTNYDILLYWVLMRNKIPNAIDGFGRDVIDQGEYVPEEDVLLSELRWGNNKESQNIFYLHGALPLFDDGIEIIKEEYDGRYILENIRTRMDKGNYPIFVTAGNGDEKLNHILHNHYLSYCYDKLSTISGSLITFGFNFGEYDEHIIKALNEAVNQDFDKKLWSIYIGVYNEDDEKHIEEIKRKFKCKVTTFDSKTVNVWD